MYYKQWDWNSNLKSPYNKKSITRQTYCEFYQALKENLTLILPKNYTELKVKECY